jgi:hypothetical protein
VVLSQIGHIGDLFDLRIRVRFGKVFFKNLDGTVIGFVLLGGGEVIQIASGKGQAEKQGQAKGKQSFHKLSRSFLWFGQYLKAGQMQ